MSPRPCITCKQPIPEGQGYPRYFAQTCLDPALSIELQNAKGELDEVFRYALAMAEALRLLTERGGDSENTLDTLGQLMQELIEEAQRRAEWLYEAGQHWRERAEADTPEKPAQPHTARKEW